MNRSLESGRLSLLTFRSAPVFVLLPSSSLLLLCPPHKQVTVPELTVRTATLLHVHKFSKHLMSAYYLLILSVKMPTICLVPLRGQRGRQTQKGRQREGERGKQREKTTLGTLACEIIVQYKGDEA